ncbi:MAG: YncE family protein, partial [Bryobacteraceae bacterium]
MKQAFGFLQSISTRGLMLAALAWPLAAAGTLGTVVPTGGQTGDIALDESRGVLYIANFTAGRIEVMSLSDLSIPRSINVNPFPNSIALSPDGRFLVVTHYGNFAKPIDPNNALTVINLNDSSRQTFGLGSAPLAVAFGNDGKALLVTTTEISQFDPVSGALSVIDTIPSLAAKTLPQDGPAFPAQITESAIGVSGDGRKIYGTTEAFGFSFDVQQKELRTFGTKGASPPFGPRSLAVNRDGSYFALGWAVLDSRGRFLWESYDTTAASTQSTTGQFHVGGYAIDSVAGLVYAQVPSTVQAAPAGGLLRVLEADNGTVRETFKLTENLAAGHAILNNARDILYAASDSGVIVLPVGSLGSQRRVVASKEDLVFRGNLCDKKVSTQEMQIVDPGGGRTDFVLSSDIPGISITPSRGVTPALVRVSVDPNGFQNQKGTLSGRITISSLNAVNVPQPVRVLINNREPDQRGTFVNIPGKIVDILADPGRDRFYVVRQDKNQILVYDGSTFNVLATLRTNNGPTQLAITRDAKFLMVGHSHAWNANVYDLDTFETQRPIEFPHAHYPLSIAVSGRSILALADNRQVGRGYNTIDSVDFLGRRAIELPSLGAITNKFSSIMTLTSTPNGAAIFGAANDGTVLLYDANADAFTTIRKDLTNLLGAYAASNNGQYVIGNNLLNASLIPVKKFETLTGSSSGFAFVEQSGYRTTTASNGGAGVIQRVDLTEATSIRPTRLV